MGRQGSFSFRGKTIRYDVSARGLTNSDSPVSPQQVVFFDPVERRYDALDCFDSELDRLPDVYEMIRDHGVAGRFVTSWQDPPEPAKPKPEPAGPLSAPAGDPHAGDPNHELYVGARGELVKELQRLLNAWGGLNANLPVTGYFDGATQSAVKAFQANKQIPRPPHPKGYVDKATWDELRRPAGAGAPGPGGGAPGQAGSRPEGDDGGLYFHALPFDFPGTGLWLPWPDAPPEPIFITDPAYLRYLNSLNYAAAFDINWSTVPTENLVLAYIAIVTLRLDDADFFLEMIEATIARRETSLAHEGDLKYVSPDLLEQLEQAMKPSIWNFGREPDKDFQRAVGNALHPVYYEGPAAGVAYRDVLRRSRRLTDERGNPIPDPRLVVLFRMTSGQVGAMEGIAGTMSVVMGDDPETILMKMDAGAALDGVAAAMAGVAQGVQNNRALHEPTPFNSRALEIQGLLNTAYVKPAEGGRPAWNQRPPGPARSPNWRRPPVPRPVWGPFLEGWNPPANDNDLPPNVRRLPLPNPVEAPKPLELPQEWKQASGAETGGRPVASAGKKQGGGPGVRPTPGTGGGTSGGSSGGSGTPSGPRAAPSLLSRVPEHDEPPPETELKLNPGEKAVYNNELPADLGMQRPGNARRDPRALRREILGEPPDYPAAYGRIPKLKANPPLNRRLMSQDGTHGTGSAVYLTEMEIGGKKQVVVVKIPHEQPLTDSVRREAVSGTLLGELGISPKVHGVVELPDGRQGIVMGPAGGDFPGSGSIKVGPQGVRDLEDAVSKMERAGIAIGDFQFFVTPEGRAIIIDAGTAVDETHEDYDRNRNSMDEEVKRYKQKLKPP